MTNKYTKTRSRSFTYYYHQNHLRLTNHISNSSTPGFKTLKLQDHLHYTDFKHELLQQKISTLLQKRL